MQEKHDNRFFQSEHVFDQFVLVAQEFETVTVPQMVRSPGFPCGQFVSAQSKNDKVGSPGCPDCFPDPSGIQFWIPYFGLGSEHARTCLCDFASFGVQDFGRFSNLVLNAFENTDAAFGPAAVSSQADRVGIGTDDGNPFISIHIQRQQSFLVLEQNDRFPGRFQGQ